MRGGSSGLDQGLRETVIPDRSRGKWGLIAAGRMALKVSVDGPSKVTTGRPPATTQVSGFQRQERSAAPPPAEVFAGGSWGPTAK